MRRKRRKPELKLEEKPFAIFQYPKLEGIRGAKKTYSKQRFISPLFGRAVKDDIVLPHMPESMGDSTRRFDAFRTKPKLTDEEAVKKYGSKYYEFTNIITNKSRAETYGSPVYESTPKQEVFADDENKIISPIGTVKTPKKAFVVEDEEIVREETYKEVIKEMPKQAQNISIQPTESGEQKRFEEPKVETFKREKEIKTSGFKVEEIKIEEKSSTYKFPSPTFFKKTNRDLDEQPDWLLNQIDIINQTLQQFGIEGNVHSSKKGPTVTRYEIYLEPGVNVRRVSNIKDNLMMNLAAETIRIEAPIPGKTYVGLEVPNVNKDIVMFGNVIDDKEFLEDHNHPLKIALGVDIDGQNIYEDIQAMPHGLIAGATNSGKSVCINTILVSLLIKNTPEDLKLILIDPKMVELAAYKDLPHLITPVITDAKMAASALNWCVEEMELRYSMFAENRAKDIKSYNSNIKNGISEGEKMPYIVIVIDELADLILAASSDVEYAIQRITQKARAAGIHLLVATQRPTTDVVKGTIKSNIPARIAFKVAAYVDSATILDSGGAEDLLGKGDMLLKRADRTHRLQGAYIPDEEIYRVTDFIRAQKEPEYLIQHETLKQSVEISDVVDEDLFKEVSYFVVMNNAASINRIQKEFKLGFNKAQRIIEMLEQYNIVSESQGTKAREVIASLNDLDQLFTK